MGSGVATDVDVGALVDVGTEVAVGAGKPADVGGVVGIGFCVDVGMGFCVGSGKRVDVGGAVGIGFCVDVGMGVCVGSGCFMVRAKMLKESTWAVAVEAVKSTAVGNWVHAPSWWC